MGIVVKDTGNRSELQQRITAELREKQRRASGQGGEKNDPLVKSIDGVDDMEYMKGFEKTNGRGWVFAAVIVGLAAAGLLIFMMMRNS